MNNKQAIEAMLRELKGLRPGLDRPHDHHGVQREKVDQAIRLGEAALREMPIAKSGDIVRVIGKNGWDGWIPRMDQFIGVVGTFKKDHNSFRMDNTDGWALHPQCVEVVVLKEDVELVLASLKSDRP